MRWTIPRVFPLAITLLCCRCESEEARGTPLLATNNPQLDAGLTDAIADTSQSAHQDGSTQADGFGADANDGDALVTATGPVLYPPNTRHSPITPHVATALRAFRNQHATRNPKNFIRLGDNLSHASHLLGCLDERNAQVSLGATSSAQGTIDWFKSGNVGGVSPFKHERDFENVTAESVFEGTSSIFDSEIAAGNPAFALVMFGTLDLYHVNGIQPDRATDHYVVERFGPAMLNVVDRLLATGIVPLVRSIPPRGASNRGPWTSIAGLANAMIRGVAQGRQVPFADLYLDTASLGPEGFWDDGLHLSASPSGACVLTDAELAYGDNRMNRLVLEQLDRVRKTVIAGEAPPDSEGFEIPDRATADEPVSVGALPFADLRKTSADVSQRANYSACGGASSESGPEHVYKLVVSQRTKVRAFVFAPLGTSTRTYIHHFANSLNDSGCKSSNQSLLELELSPGTHYFVVDAVPGSDLASAEYVFGLDPCPANDSTCMGE